MKLHWNPRRSAGLPLLFLSTMALAMSIAASNAHATVITFEGYPDSTVLTTQYSGVTFSNAEIITAEYSLDEQDFPPESGVNVAVDDGGPMQISFTTPVTGFSGYFTYTEPLTLQAFDAGGNSIPGLTTTSPFSMDDVSSFNPSLGNYPDELVSVGSGSVPFSSVLITGDPNGFSFTVDNVSTSTSSSTVPEPGSLFLLGGTLASLAAFRFCSRTRRPVRRYTGVAMLSLGLMVWTCAMHAQTITASINQPGLAPNTNTNVTITATFSVAPTASSVILQQINSSGAITNPNLGTLTKINPTTFTITTPFNIANGSTLLQVSAGFPGKIVRVVSNSISVYAPPAASTLTVSYSGNIPILQDMNGSAPIIANPMYVDNPAASNPVAFAAGTTMMVGITFAQNPVPAAPIANVTVTGTITNGPMGPTKFTANNVTLPAAAVATISGLAADAALQANLVQYFSAANPMTIRWSYMVNGNTTNIGTSTNPLYVTLAAPVNAATAGKPAGSVFLTDLKFAASNPGATTPAQALANTWSLFTTNPGPANITTWDSRVLSYYPTGTGFGGCATSEQVLLTSAAGAGQCGSFAFLLAGSLNANGIGVNGGTGNALVTVAPKAAERGFLVNNWTYAAAGTSGDAGYPFKLVFVNAFEMVPAQPTGVYGDLTSNAGIAGQNSPTPSEKAFGQHFIILPDAPLNTMYYDPSYGVTYANGNDFEMKAVAGYIKSQTAIMQTTTPNVFFDRKTVNGAGGQLQNIQFSR